MDGDIIADPRSLTEVAFAVAVLARGSLLPVRALAQARNIPIDFRLPETTTRIGADRSRLLGVLINLVSNAVTFIPDDGRIVLCTVRSETGALIFSVADTGIGMTAKRIQTA